MQLSGFFWDHPLKGDGTAKPCCEARRSFQKLTSSDVGYNVAQRENYMPANAVVRARIDEKTKNKATKVLKQIGMTPSAAFRLMMTRIAVEREMPFDIHVPNAETIAAIEEGRKGKLKTFETVEALMAELNAQE